MKIIETAVLVTEVNEVAGIPTKVQAVLADCDDTDLLRLIRIGWAERIDSALRVEAHRRGIL